ncbi:hypothetical protein Tco_1531523 [Tanacetum coccineum]
MKCQPLNFKGTEGVVGLSRRCSTNLWNGHVRTLGPWMLLVSMTLVKSRCWRDPRTLDDAIGWPQRLDGSEIRLMRKGRSDCPVLKNQGTEARGMVYALGGGETDQDTNNMEDDINA